MKGLTYFVALVALALLLQMALFKRQPTQLEQEMDPTLCGMVMLLERSAPLRHPVEIQMVSEPGYAGLTRVNDAGDGFIIQIDASMCLEAQVDTLLHEWAHAMVWGVWQPKPHGHVWAAAYGFCYRASIGE